MHVVGEPARQTATESLRARALRLLARREHSRAELRRKLVPHAEEGTDLEKVLKEKNIQTVIVAGTAAHGAVLATASGAALRGMKVVVPADGLSAETLYPEQYTLWHLLNAPRIGAQVTVTRTDLISY